MWGMKKNCRNVQLRMSSRIQKKVGSCDCTMRLTIQDVVFVAQNVSIGAVTPSVEVICEL